ncbi:MAG: hypothetical protein ABI237_18075 [Ginsengibacter sp.]
MKKFTFFLFILLSSQLTEKSVAQTAGDPVAYMSSISNAQTEMNQKYMAYMSAAAHSRRARKIEKLRQQVLQSIDNSRFKTVDIPLYKGDNSLRQSSIDYIKLCYNVFDEDYNKIVNMEDIAEQSYDEMQAYLLLREKTNDKIGEAVAKMSEATKAFAAKYNIQLIDKKGKLDSKLEDAGKVNDYMDSVYLIFFKCYWQDGEIVKAMNKQKLTGMEQGRTSLIRFADEGLATLSTMKPFADDASLANTCKQVLQFYKKMAEQDLPRQTDYFLKNENFEKIKKSFEDKSKKERTKEEVDTYNKSVNDINTALKTFNTVNQSINETRSNLLDNWNEAEKNFADNHIPYYK